MIKVGFIAISAVLLASVNGSIYDFVDNLPDTEIDNDAYKSVQDIVQENGFGFEQYFVTTEDNYILNLHRIPGYFNESHVKNTTAGIPRKPVVLLQHGIEADSVSWMLNE